MLAYDRDDAVKRIVFIVITWLYPEQLARWAKALQQDVDLFGDRAFKEGWPRDLRK